MIPKGYVTLREALIQLAVVLAPDARIRECLAPAPEADTSLRTILGDAARPGAAWEALEAARDGLQQLLCDGDQRASVMLPSGKIVPIKIELWRTHAGYGALRTGRLHGRIVLLREATADELVAAVDVPAPKPEAGHTLRHANIEKIHRVITRVYDIAEGANLMPPNVAVVPHAVIFVLENEGYEAPSKNSIQTLASADRHKNRRSEPGKSSKRRGLRAFSIAAFKDAFELSNGSKYGPITGCGRHARQ